MSLLKRVIKSFRQLFQIKQSSVKKKKRLNPKKRSVSNKIVRKKSKVVKKVGSSRSVKKIPQKDSQKFSKQKVSSNKTIKAETKKSAEKFEGKFVGDITHYFNRIQVAVLEVKSGSIKSGQQIHIKGAKSDFIQSVNSMQVESVDVKSAKKGDIIGLKVKKEVQIGDKVFLVE